MGKNRADLSSLPREEDACSREARTAHRRKGVILPPCVGRTSTHLQPCGRTGTPSLFLPKVHEAATYVFLTNRDAYVVHSAPVPSSRSGAGPGITTRKIGLCVDLPPKMLGKPPGLRTCLSF